MHGRRHLLAGLLAVTLARCEQPGELRPEARTPAQPLQAEPPDWELALEPDPHWVLARVQVGDETVLAAFDTGLSVAALADEAWCAARGLPDRRGRWSTDGGQGRGYQHGTELPAWSWGDFQVQAGMRALRGDLSFLREPDEEPIRLILGLQAFARYTVQLDLPAARVRLWQELRLPEASGHPHVLPYRRRRGVPFCVWRVGEHDLGLLLDSGYAGGLALPDSLRGQLPLRGEAHRTGSVRTLLGEGGAIHTGRLAIPVEWAGYRMKDPGVQFLEGYRHAVLGRAALDVLVLSFDQQQGRLHVAAVDRPTGDFPVADILRGLRPREAPPASAD